MKKIFLVHYNSICKQKPLDLLIVADCLLNRTFVNALCERLNSNADLFYIDTSRKTRTPILIRHASYFILALKVFFLEKEYKIIIFWQQFIGLYYGLLSYLKKTERPNAFLMPFIFKQRKGALGKIHKLLFSLALRCSAIRAVICHSSCEMMYYQRIFSRNRNKIYFIPYGQSSENEDNNKHLLADKPYFFSGGTSNRDYVTLASAAAKTKYYFIIACTQTDIKGLNMPSNFKVIHDAYRKKFDSLVKECLAVIIPLKDPNISSGQIFLLKAMQMGKPVVVTKSAGILDYVDEHCAFLVDHNNPEDLQRALEFIILNPEEAETRAKRAQEKYHEKFNIQQFAFSLADLLEMILIKRKNDSLL